MIVGYAEWEDTQKDILDRVNTGETVSSLAREYGTTPNIMSLHVEKLRKRKKLLEENELYSSMYYSEIEVDAKTARRIVNSLNRVNVTTISDLQKLTIEELLDIRNLGLGQIEVMEKLGWIHRDGTEPKRSVGATTSLLSGEPCSWKQRCEELEQVIFKTYKELNVDPILIDKLCGNPGYILSKEEIEKAMEGYGMAVDERYFYSQHGIDIEKVYSERILGHCKDCKYFEYDSVAKVDGIPLIVAHEICSKWGNGCKTKEDGYCFLFKPKEEKEDE